MPTPIENLQYACNDYLADERTLFNFLYQNRDVIEKLRLAVANIDSRLLVLEGGTPGDPDMTLDAVIALSSTSVKYQITVANAPSGSVLYVQHALLANVNTGPWTVDHNAAAVDGLTEITVTGLSPSTDYIVRAFFTLSGSDLVPYRELEFDTAAGSSPPSTIQDMINDEMTIAPFGGPTAGGALGGGGPRVKEGPNSTFGTYAPEHITSVASGFTAQFWKAYNYAVLGQADFRIQPWHQLFELASAPWGSPQPHNPNHLLVGIAVRKYRAAYCSSGVWYPIVDDGDLILDLGERTTMESLAGGAGRWETDISSDGVSPRVRQLYNANNVQGNTNTYGSHGALQGKQYVSAAHLAGLQCVVVRMQARVEPLTDLGGTATNAANSTYLMDCGLDRYPTDRNASQAQGDPDWITAIVMGRYVPIGTDWTDCVAVQFSNANAGDYPSTLTPLPEWFTA